MLRVSKDRRKLLKSIEEQHEENQLDADENGNTLHPVPYVEVGSASVFRRKPRGDFTKLMKDLEEDTFGADVLKMWEGSRGSRKVVEAAQLYDLCADKGVVVRITDDDRTYDPRKATDYRDLINAANAAEFEVRHSSSRIRRNASSAARKGHPHGPAPFGFDRRYDPETKEPLNVPNSAEARIVFDMYMWIAGGKSVSKLDDHLWERGVRAKNGGRLELSRIRYMLLNESYAGQRIHDPNRNHTAHRSPDAKVHDGEWPSLLVEQLPDESDEAWLERLKLKEWQEKARRLWLTVNRTMRAPDRRTTRTGRATHTWTAVLLCGVCRAQTRVRKDVSYVCTDGGHVALLKNGTTGVDRLLDTVMMKFLRSEQIYEVLARGHDPSELTEVDKRILSAEDELKKYREQARRLEISAETVGEITPGIEALIKEMKAKRDKMIVPNNMRYMLGVDESERRMIDVAARWENAAVATRRSIARQFCIPETLGVPLIMPSPVSHGRVPAIQRIMWDRTGSGV